MERPFPAYEGEQLYIFVSYAHADAAIVYPQIRRLQEGGFNVWWDEGISPGERWSDELGERIAGSSLFLYLITPKSTASQNCLDEAHFALDHAKPFLAVHLEETELPIGLSLRLGSRQAILKYQLPAEEYTSKLLKSIHDHVEPGDASARTAPPPSVGRHSTRTILIGAGAIAVAIVVAAFLSRSVGPPEESHKQADTGVATLQPPPRTSDDTQPSLFGDDRPSIAVLAFDNMSGDPDQEYFSDGLTDEIISTLSRSPDLLVIARNSSFVYKGKATDVKQIGEELGVRYVLEGSVRRGGNRVRINARLVGASTGGHLWTDTYERDLTDILVVQADIAQQIAGHLQVEYRAMEIERVRPIPIEELNAREVYWRGLHEVYQWTMESNRRARGFLERAIEMDPASARAYILLGDVLLQARFTGWDPDPNILTRSMELAQTANEIDPSFPGINRLLSVIHQQQGELDRAIALADRELASNPNDADSISQKAAILIQMGSWEDGIAVQKQAIRLNPHPPVNYLTGLAMAHEWLWQYQEAHAALQQALAVNRGSAVPYWQLARLYISAWVTQSMPSDGLLRRALAIAERGAALNPEFSDAASTVLRVSVAEIHWRQGQYGETVAEIEGGIAAATEAATLWGDWAVNAYSILHAAVLTSTGQLDEAMALAEQLEPAGSPFLFNTLGLAYRLSGRMEEAVAACAQALEYRENPWVPTGPYHLDAHVSLSIIHMLTGDKEEARAEATEVLKLSPDFSVAVWGKRNPLKDRAQVERDMAALKEAGLK